MTDRELMQQALDAATEELPKVDERETVFCSIQGHHLRALCEFVRAALAQPEPEELARLEQAMIEAWKPIPQREWQGLTDEEIENCFEMSMFGTCRAIEAKLKEKNG